MTDDPHDLDELASAHLDGVTTPEEAARVEADPDLRARVDALREVRDQLRAAAAADGPIDAARRDAAITAALAQVDDPLLADVTPIAEARRRRGRAARWVAAAAVLALGAARIVPSMFDTDDSGSEDVAAQAQEEGEDEASEELERGTGGAFSAGPEAGEAGDTEDSSGGAMQSTTTNRAAAGPPQAGSDLGSFPDLAALTAVVRDALVDSPAIGSAPLPSDAVSSCLTAAEAEALAAGATFELTAVAVVADLPVVVTVTTAPDGTRTLDVVDPAAACALVHRAVL